MKNGLFSLIAACLLVFNLSAQEVVKPNEEVKVTIRFIAYEKIAQANVDKDRYLKNLSDLIDLAKKEFAQLGKDQKVALVVTCHKAGPATLSLHSNPKLGMEREQRFLGDVRKLSLENTKFTDFPVVICVNVNEATVTEEFPEIVSPMDIVKREYEKADLKTKLDLNKNWAINEVVPIMAAYEVKVEEKFVGVRELGKLCETTDFTRSQDINKLTNHNNNYWRADVEMNRGNQLVPATKIFMHMTQGEFDYAYKYAEFIKMFASPKTNANDYLEELLWRLDLFNNDLKKEINLGIEEHDKGNYEKAIEVYDRILKVYPGSAWARYEKYYSENARDLKKGKIKADDRSGWDKAKVEIYRYNPLYSMDVRASNAREGYLMFRRQEINTLFKEKEMKESTIYKSFAK